MSKLERYVAYPATVVELAKEMVKIVDDYRARKLSNVEVREIISFYASTHPGKFYDSDSLSLNKTVARLLGVKRRRIVNALLNKNTRS